MNLLQFVRGVIREELRYLHTSLYGRVVAVDMNASRPTCDVEVLVRRGILSNENTDVTYRDYPILRDVPLAFPKSSAALIEHKVEPGDWVELRCAYHSIDELLTQDVNGPVDPADLRTHALQDAIAVPVDFNSTWAYRSTTADYQIEADEIRLGRPSIAKALVNEILQDRLDNYHNALMTYLGTGTSVSGGAVSFTGPQPTPVNVPLTSHLKGS